MYQPPSNTMLWVLAVLGLGLIVRAKLIERKHLRSNRYTRTFPTEFIIAIAAAAIICEKLATGLILVGWEALTQNTTR